MARGKGLGGGFVLVDGGEEQGRGASASHAPSRAQTVGADDSARHITAEQAASSSSPVLLPREKSSSPEELSEYIHVSHESAGGFPSALSEDGLHGAGDGGGGGEEPETPRRCRGVAVGVSAAAAELLLAPAPAHAAHAVVREVGQAEQGREVSEVGHVQVGHVQGAKPTNAKPSKSVGAIFSPRQNSPMAALAGTIGHPPSEDGAAVGSLAGASGRDKSSGSPRLSCNFARRAAEKQVPSSSLPPTPFPFLPPCLPPFLPVCLFFPRSPSSLYSHRSFRPRSLSSSPAIQPFFPLSNPEPTHAHNIHPPFQLMLSPSLTQLSTHPPHAHTIPSLLPPPPSTDGGSRATHRRADNHNNT